MTATQRRQAIMDHANAVLTLRSQLRDRMSRLATIYTVSAQVARSHAACNARDAHIDVVQMTTTLAQHDSDADTLRIELDTLRQEHDRRLSAVARAVHRIDVEQDVETFVKALLPELFK